jgi:glutaredoxin
MINKKIWLPLFAGIYLLFLPACNPSVRDDRSNGISASDQSVAGKVEVKDLIIYGSKTCPHCMAFIQKMDREGIPYTFKEVDNDDQNYQEMFDKIKSINFKGYVNYPVVDVGGEILVAPNFEKFYSAYRR